MADRTSIEWTDATWNPIVGCSVVSPGCTNCYAMRLAGTRLKHHPSRAGLTVDTKAGPVWTGETRFDERVLTQPLRWRRPRKIFVCAHSDLFHEATPDAWIDSVFAVMALCPQHTFQVLTKRPERMREYLDRINREFHGSPDNLNERFGEHCVQLSGDPCAAGWFEDEVNWPLPNVWLGVTAEDQARADERVPVLLATPAAKRFVSVEPMLGAIDLISTAGGILWIGGQRGHAGRHSHGGRPGTEIHGTIHETDPRISHHHHDERCKNGLDWVICGGESGPNARPMHPAWVRSLRNQCAAASVPFLFKQWGEWVSVLDRARDDPDWRADYSREFDHRHATQRWLNLAGGTGFHGEGFQVMRRVGKRAAGRLLDGVEHLEFPEATNV